MPREAVAPPVQVPALLLPQAGPHPQGVGGVRLPQELHHVRLGGVAVLGELDR